VVTFALKTPILFRWLEKQSTRVVFPRKRCSTARSRGGWIGTEFADFVQATAPIERGGNSPSFGWFIQENTVRQRDRRGRPAQRKAHVTNSNMGGASTDKVNGRRQRN
jgi:hypothetical protein